jgi:acyl-CoA thioester hydrolase
LINRTHLRVRYAETDRMGVVYHANYLVWMEMGRTNLMRDGGLTYNDLEAMGFMLPVIEARVKYEKSADYDEEVMVESACTEIGATKVRIDYRISRAANGELLAWGHTEHATIDAKNRRIVRLPAIFREKVAIEEGFRKA